MCSAVCIAMLVNRKGIDYVEGKHSFLYVYHLFTLRNANNGSGTGYVHIFCGKIHLLRKLNVKEVKFGMKIVSNLVLT